MVQWATVLAPPRSGASTTLRLVAEVKDFQVPAFDVAVQPGLNTDLSADGVLAGAFSSGAGSEMELQRRTISLVSDVNTVLTQGRIHHHRGPAEPAGDLADPGREDRRANCGTTPQALAATMSDLKEQLQVLGARPGGRNEVHAVHHHVPAEADRLRRGRDAGRHLGRARRRLPLTVTAAPRRLPNRGRRPRSIPAS